jgi:hypothetical protein
MTDDDLTPEESRLFQLMADGVITDIRNQGGLGAWQYSCTVSIHSAVSERVFYSKISALDAYLQAVAFITASALEGKVIYAPGVRGRRKRLGLE